MINLLIKDFRLMFGNKQSLSKRIVSVIFSALFFVAFIVVEIFLFRTILKTIKDIKYASTAFLTLFLFVTTILITIGNLFQAKRLFFDAKDIEQLSNRPVSNTQIIMSKLLYLFFIHYATSIMFEYPLFVAYGLLANKSPMFYYTGLFYPVATFFFEMGVALLLVYPLWLFTRFIKRRFWLEMTVSLVLICGLTLVYSYVLDIFIKLVADNDLLSLFSQESINGFISFQKYAFPVNFLIDIFFNKHNSALFPFLCISLGVFGMGLSIAIFAFNYVRNFSASTTINKKPRPFKTKSVTSALIKKEFGLIAKNSDYIFSYTGLLIAQPLLLYFVTKSINTVLNSGTIQYFAALVPGLIDYVDILLVMMFTVIINQGANSYITMEERTIKNMKTIPVPFGKQLVIKVSIPFVLSSLSLIISCVVLWATKTITLQLMLFALLISIVLLFVFQIISLWEELSIRHGKPRSSSMSSLFSYLLPVVYAVTAILLSYKGLPTNVTIWGGLAVIVVIGAVPVTIVFTRANSMFLSLEAIN